MEAVLSGTDESGWVASSVADALAKQNIPVGHSYQFKQNGLSRWGYVADMSHTKISFAELQSQMRALSKELLSDIRVQRTELFVVTNRILFPVQELNF
jgi:predicted amino acid-binding ACT domain protein